MFLTLIISFLVLSFFILLMYAGYLITGNVLKGSCSDDKENPCTCTLAEKLNCQKKILNQQ